MSINTGSADPPRTHLPAHLEPVHAGQAQIEDQQVVGSLQGALESGGTRLFDGHEIALATEGARERCGDGLVVLGQQYGGHATTLRPVLVPPTPLGFATIRPVVAMVRFVPIQLHRVEYLVVEHRVHLLHVRNVVVLRADPPTPTR